LSTALAFTCAVLLIVLDVPIGAAFLTGDIVAIALFGGDAALMFLPSTIFTKVTTLALLAVPLFILSADLMLRIGVGDAVMNLALKATFGRRRLVPAGAVASAVFFGGITGSSVAEAAALGRLLYPVMRRRGFHPRKVAGLLAASATIGILIPPSIPLIVYGGVTQTSVAQLFKASLVPGLVTAAVFALAGILLVRPTIPAGEDQAEVRAAAAEDALPVNKLTALFALGAPVVILGGIYSGLATPTEAAGVLVIYSLLGVLLFRPRGFFATVWRSALDTMKTTAALFLILIGALVFAQIATQDQIPQAIAAFVTSANLSPVVFLLALNLVVFVFGVLFEGLGMLLVIAPIIVVAAAALHLNLVYLGVMLVVNIELSVITPPLGVNLLTISAVTGMRPAEVMRSIAPFYPIPLALLLLIILFPQVIATN
jgi:C4-dicarboxylate transporter DctM subunit